jgi:hypothetical protein
MRMLVMYAMSADIEWKPVIVLYNEAYSSLAENFKTGNVHQLKLIDMLYKHPGEKEIDPLTGDEIEGNYTMNFW